jgi:radical SAM superfamily enzyme YgiQ (UPF0313 family)
MLNIALISLYGVENNGIRSISSVLQEAGFNTYLIFFKRWANNDMRYPTEKERNALILLLKKLNIDMVGLSFTSPLLKIASALTLRIKDTLQTKVVWGGIHATVNPEECLKYCDIVCRGEGEYAMLDLVNAYANKYSLEGIKNTCYRKEGKINFEEIRPLIQSLDYLPYQDYGGKNKFFIDKGRLQNIDPLVYAAELRTFASRGCPFNCSYCYNSIFRKLYRNQRYHRIKSVEVAISEIEYALSKFRGVRKIKFDDDTFIFPEDWVDEFCKQYKNRIGLPFEILFNAECLNEKFLKDLKAVGLRRVQVGIQTGSKRESEEIYNRSLPIEKIRQFADVSKSLKLNVVYDVILDNPLASFNDKESLIDFLLSLPRPFDLFLYSLTIFPGTQLCELLLKKGLIKPKDVEGEANKSFYQFRLNFSYPRNKEELFVACIVSLISKSFIPKSFIVLLKRSYFLKNHPLPLKWFAQFCNLIKLAHILVKMLIQKDLNIWKFKEYGLPKRYLIQ